MHAEDETGDGHLLDALEQLRHDLKTPLTTIYARAYLLTRAIRRAPSLSDEERGSMLERVAAIETAVRTMTGLVDVIGLSSGDGPGDSVEARR